MVRQVLADRSSAAGHWFVDADNPVYTDPFHGAGPASDAAPFNTTFLPNQRATAARLVAC